MFQILDKIGDRILFLQVDSYSVKLQRNQSLLHTQLLEIIPQVKFFLSFTGNMP